MGLDDGQEGFDIDQVKARLRGEIRRKKFSFEQLCDVCGVSPGAVLRALELGSDGFPETLEVLQHLSVGLGRDPNWLPFAVEGEHSVEERDDDRARKLVWEFIYKAPIIDKQMREKLLSEALRPFQFGSHSTQRFRQQSQIRTLKDVLSIYNRLLNENLWKPR